MAVTYTPIATQTLGSAQASVTFSSISASYTDLILVMSANSSRTDTDSYVGLQFNSDTASNYSNSRLVGNGNSASSARNSSDTSTNGGFISASTATASGPTPVIMQIQNYSNTTTYKTVLSRSSENMSNSYTTINGLAATVSLWRSTSAIDTIKIITITGFTSGSTFTLYGIKAA